MKLANQTKSNNYWKTSKACEQACNSTTNWWHTGHLLNLPPFNPNCRAILNLGQLCQRTNHGSTQNAGARSSRFFSGSQKHRPTYLLLSNQSHLRTGLMQHLSLRQGIRSRHEAGCPGLWNVYRPCRSATICREDLTLAITICLILGLKVGTKFDFVWHTDVGSSEDLGWTAEDSNTGNTSPCQATQCKLACHVCFATPFCSCKASELLKGMAAKFSKLSHTFASYCMYSIAQRDAPCCICKLQAN